MSRTAHYQSFYAQQQQPTTVSALWSTAAVPQQQYQHQQQFRQQRAVSGPVPAPSVAFSSQIEEVDRAVQKLMKHGQYPQYSGGMAYEQQQRIAAPVSPVDPSQQNHMRSGSSSFTGFNTYPFASGKQHLAAGLPPQQQHHSSTTQPVYQPAQPQPQQHTVHRGLSPKVTFDPFGPVTVEQPVVNRSVSPPGGSAFASSFNNTNAMNNKNTTIGGGGLYRGSESRVIDSHLGWSSKVWGAGSVTTSVWG